MSRLTPERETEIKLYIQYGCMGFERELLAEIDALRSENRTRTIQCEGCERLKAENAKLEEFYDTHVSEKLAITDSETDWDTKAAREGK